MPKRIEQIILKVRTQFSNKNYGFYIEELAQLKGFDEEVANQVETIYNISREDNSVENDEYYHQLDSLFKNIQVMEPGKQNES